MRAVVIEANAAGKLAIREAEDPRPRYDEALVRVQAVSLNRGETKMAIEYPRPDWRPGWDLAGVVERAAEDGSGPKAGEQVVGLVRSGAWAEQAAVPTNALASLPEGVTLAQAATLPVAGLTAYHALRQGGFLLGKNVLITGATGGVGDYALQLARLSGARVIASVRRPDQIALAEASGAETVVVGEDLSQAAAALAPYDLIIDSVGGKSLGDALSLLSEGGVCVSLGVSAGAEVTFNAATFFLTGRASLYGLILFDELKTVEPAALGLARLAGLIAAGKVTPHISVEADWTEVAEVADQLLKRRYPGKAVLHIR